MRTLDSFLQDKKPLAPYQQKCSREEELVGKTPLWFVEDRSLRVSCNTKTRVCFEHPCCSLCG